MSDMSDFFLVNLVLLSLLIIQRLLFHVPLPIFGWSRITTDSMTTAPMVAIILLCAAQTIDTTQGHDVLDDIINPFISLAFMVITPDGANDIRRLYLCCYFHLTSTATPVLRKPSQRKRKKRRREKKKHIGTAAPLLEVDYRKPLGSGSIGSVVYEGLFQGRPVAVKCLPKYFVTIARHEIDVLQRSDYHLNIIRYHYYQDSDPQFIQIALDLCPASLADIIENLHDSGAGSGSERMEEWAAIAHGFDAKKAMKQIASGLKHLHGLGLVHRDIKPQNILISSYSSPGSKYRMLISDFGLCKKLEVDQSSFSATSNGAMAAGTAGWRAPETLHRKDNLDELTAGDHSTSSRGSQASTINGASSGAPTPNSRLTKSIDVFALGCLFYYILTEGKHPFGDHIHREANIINNNKDLSLRLIGEEAHDLISRMLHPRASQRPDIDTCLLHPFFWDSEKRLDFLREVSDSFEAMCKDPPMDAALLRLERDAKNIVGSDWHQTFDETSDQILIKDLRKSRKYKGESVRDLLRVLRNKRNHYQDLPDNVKLQLGPMPESFLRYFTSRYPKLLVYVHEVVQDTGLHRESRFKSYFELSES